MKVISKLSSFPQDKVEDYLSGEKVIECDTSKLHLSEDDKLSLIVNSIGLAYGLEQCEENH